MNIEVKFQLLGLHWGFSDLLNGRLLNNETKEEIIELIKEDPITAFKNNESVEVFENCNKEVKEAFEEFINNNPDACSADYASWHSGWNACIKYLRK